MALSHMSIHPSAVSAQASPGTSRSGALAQPTSNTAFAELMRGGSPSTERPRNGDTHSALLAASMNGSRHLVLAGRTPSDLMRAQTFNRPESLLGQHPAAIPSLPQSVVGTGSTLDLARSMGAALHIGAITGSFDSRLRGLNMGDFVHSRRRAASKSAAAAPTPKSTPAVEATGLGQLSARFESGSDGVAAVGYDRNGGTSYGKYQVSSRAGSLGDFLDFLDTEAPELSRRLRASGPGNTGSRHGAMPDTWRAIANEQPERFEQLQEAFVRQSHYEPAVHAIVERTGLTEATLSNTMREVIWSTAVQHGPAGAARIFARADALSGAPTDPAYERNLISHVYNIRVGQFGSSTSSVQAAVANRFKQEKAIALRMLGNTDTSSLA